MAADGEERRRLTVGSFAKQAVPVIFHQEGLPLFPWRMGHFLPNIFSRQMPFTNS
jgi:hypothetical protein